MRRGDGVWYNVGGDGDRGLVLEVAWRRRKRWSERAFPHAHPGELAECCRVLWHDGTPRTLRPQPWHVGEDDRGIIPITRGDMRHWYRVSHLRIEHPYSGDGVDGPDNGVDGPDKEGEEDEEEGDEE